MDQPLAKLDEFLAALETAMADGSLVRVALRQPESADKSLKSIDIRPVAVKGGRKLAIVVHRKTQDVTQTVDAGEGIGMIRDALSTGFRQGYLYATGFDLLFDRQGKAPRLSRSAATASAPASLEHNRSKTRPIPASRPYLKALGMTGADGAVLKGAGDKYRQINRYVEILGPLLAAIPAGRLRRVVDMGAGKGYLTFAVADYLASTLQRETEVVGVELRPELVAEGNAIAKANAMAGLKFAAGTIESFDASGADVLIALHACDTATDDAIAKGIAAEAELIVVAPCCHKQIRREIEASNQATALDFLLKHGIFVERQAEMVTDAMRAMILEHFGYATKVFEFVSDVHTPKNVLIVAERTKRGKAAAALEKLTAAKAFFGIRRHYLEDATGL